MYVCGPTVYSFPHIGNARPAVIFDVLARLLRTRLPSSPTPATSPTSTTRSTGGRRAGRADRRDRRALHGGVPRRHGRARRAAAGPGAARDGARAGDHRDDRARWSQAGMPTRRKATCCSAVRSFAGYGELSGRDRRRHARRRARRGRALQGDAGDFVLWKPSTPELPGWDSPVGPRPAGLAHRMLGDGRRSISGAPSTSTAAAST